MNATLRFKKNVTTFVCSLAEIALNEAEGHNHDDDS